MQDDNYFNLELFCSQAYPLQTKITLCRAARRIWLSALLLAAIGHFVRTNAEMLIDNWLYIAEIVDA